jgi:cardiolipin synthase
MVARLAVSLEHLVEHRSPPFTLGLSKAYARGGTMAVHVGTFDARSLTMTRNPILNVPNIITLVRFGLIPVTAWLLWQGVYGWALLVFLTAAISDFVDGVIARTFNQTSAIGAALDPLADKLNMFVATVMLAWHGLLPLWLALAIVLRDVVIVSGALAYRAKLGHVEIAPTMLSKVNTFIEFGVLLTVMANAAAWIDAGAWLPAVFVLVFATVVASGAQYVWIWGWKAASEWRTAR